MNGLRVLLVSHNYPPHLGGLEVVVQQEAHRLAERGATVSVVSSAVTGEPGGVTREGKVRVHRVRAWSGLERASVPFPVFSPALVGRLWREVRRADVVHIHDTLYISSWVAAVLCRLLRRPYVVTLHVGLVHHPSPVVRLVQEAVRRTAGRFVTRAARAVLPITGFVSEANRGMYHDDSVVTVLPNGVDTSLFRPAVDAAERESIRRQLSLPLDETLVLYVGRFVPKKGFDLLVASRHPDFRVVFAGGGRPPEVTDPRHIFLGQLDAEDLARVYRAVDLFVSASIGECPLTVLEAMASGLPVLLNDDPGHRSLDLPDDAVVWGRLRGGRLPDLVAATLRDTDRLHGLRARAREVACSHHSWDAHAEQLTAVYGAAMSDAPRPDPRTRVAVVTPYFAPSVGGVESYTAHLAAALRDSPRHDVVVLTTNRSSRTRRDTVDGVPVVRLGRWLTVSNTPVNPLWPLRLPRLLRSLGVDVVSAHAPVPFLADVVTLRVRRTPVLLTYHSGSLRKGVGGPVDAALGLYERAVLPRVFARADTLLAASPAASSHRHHEAEVVPPGVDTATFGYAPDPGGARLLYVGRIERTSRWKGLHVLVAAFAAVVSEVPEAELHLVGAGDGVDELLALAARLDVGGRVHWRGALHGPELVAAYQDATLVVLPSLTEAESFGMTLVEAMACGRPVVASDVGGPRFVVRPGVDGLLTPPGDATALAEAVVGLLRDPGLRSRLGRAGRQAAEQRWDWTHSTRRMLELLEAADPKKKQASRGGPLA